MGTEPLLQQALGERSFSALYYMLAGAPDEVVFVLQQQCRD
jgi:hypothetical protein